MKPKYRYNWKTKEWDRVVKKILIMVDDPYLVGNEIHHIKELALAILVGAGIYADKKDLRVTNTMGGDYEVTAWLYN